MSIDAELAATLNPAQHEAVWHGDGPLLVLAGAGSGKTRVLTARIARLIGTRGVAPEHILAVTFTNKAAGEMRARVGRVLGGDVKGIWLGTFHSVGARMLRAATHLVGRTAAFTIYDQDESLAVIKRVMADLSISTKQFAPRAIQSAVSDAKNALVGAEEYRRLARDPFSRAASDVYDALEAALRRANAVDFDDLLVLPVRMLQQHADRLAAYRGRFRHVLVDEYQDTNRAQYELVRLLGGEHGNVCVVGDEDQSIYGWRGADIRNILDFSKDFPNAKVVRLEENYRSAPPILQLANVVISENTERMGKTLRPTRAGGELPVILRALDERDEAEWLVAEILTRRGAATPISLRDAAVLYRTNAQSRALEEALRRHSVPYRLVGAVRFYDRREIRDVMSYLKLIANPADDEAFRRAVSVPKRGLGDTTIDFAGGAAKQHGLSIFEAVQRADVLESLRPAARSGLGAFVSLIQGFRHRATDASVDELLREVLETVRYAEYLMAEGPEGAERLENVRELVTGAAELVADDLGEVGLTELDRFLQRAALVADTDAFDATADAVTLMTVHNAKGLEFPLVFITGLEDGLFPLAKAYENPPLLEEERRLLYVGITRAESKVYLTHAEERRRNGELLAARPSSFLDGLPDSLVERRSTIKVRSSGRAAMRGAERSWIGKGVEERFSLDTDRERVSPAMRRPGNPVRMGGSRPNAAGSDLMSRIRVGARVRHRKFGTGTVAELTGLGNETKVRVDFDDDTIGRKTLVVAQANLEAGDE